MAHIHDVYDQDNHFVIDPITRDITSQSEKISITQYDHNSERFTFEIPKIIEGHDMSLCDKVRVHFINIGSNRSNVSKGVYEVDDIRVSSDDSDMLLFSWLISRAATEYSGKLNFSIRFYCISDDNIVDYSWATSIFTGVKISNGIDNSEAITEDYVDILEQWKSEIAMKIDDINSKIESIKIPEIPTKLPNPQSLTFTGAVNASYDGSSEVSVEIPDAYGATETAIFSIDSVTFVDNEDGKMEASIDMPMPFTEAGIYKVKIGNRSGIAGILQKDIDDWNDIYKEYGEYIDIDLWDIFRDEKNLNESFPDGFYYNNTTLTLYDDSIEAGEYPVSITKVDAYPSIKMDKVNPTAIGSFSLNRKPGSTIGAYSHAEGQSTTASGSYSHTEGAYTTASASCSHAEGSNTTASGEASHAEGYITTASGKNSHAEGQVTTAKSENQHVQGKYNIEDSSGVYADIIGNGIASKRSNAATVDWSGNAWYAGDVYVGSTSGTNKDEGSKKLATEEYVDNSIASIDIPTTLPNPQSLTFTGAAEGTYDGSSALTVDIPSAPEIPTKLPNPQSLTFTGAVTGSYDGSASLSVNIPSALADLTTDSAHRLVTDTEKSTWNAKAEVSAIPTKVSQLTNDSGYITSAPVTSVNGKTGAVTLTIPSKTSDITNDSDFATNSDVTTGISTHNSSTEAHNDIRLLVQELTNKLNTLADSDDTTLDQLSEIVAYIKNNKSLIDGITTSKVSVTDIIDNLTTSVTNKPLSAKQGVALKALIDAIVVPTKLPNPNAITFTGAAEGTYDGSSALTVDIPSAPEIPTQLPNPKSLTFTGAVTGSYDGSNEVSVEIPGALSDLSEDATHRVVTDAEKAKWNAKSNFSGSYNDLTDKPTIPDAPVQSVNGKTGAVVLSAEDVGALPGSTVIPTALPNPNTITFTGAVTGSYDGSNPLTVEIPRAPTVPENISAFKNDVGYLTKHQDVSGKIDKPSSGVVGQVLAVKTVDENGRPAEFDCVYQTSGVTIPIVDSVDEMVDTSKQYILKSTGTIWVYKTATTEQEVTITDELDDTTYYDNSRLGSSATGLTDGFHNDATGYHITPLIDLTKAKYQGKTIQIHFEGAKYITSATETWIQHRYYKTDRSVLYARGYSSPSDSGSVGAWKNATMTINSETSATIEIAMPLLCGAANVQCGYLRFCGKGTVADSHIYITYKKTQTVTSEQWVNTGIQYGGGGLDAETAAKISALNNEGNSPSIIKLLPKPVLDFYNAAAYSDSDYSYSHLEKITYPCRADIPVPFTVKWSHNENAMRTTVAVDTKAIGTVNAYTMRTYDATGLDNYPIYNLLPNKTYYYKVTHVLSDGSLVEAKSGSFTTSAESWRPLYIEGTQNVRDLGGWTGLNGKKVKYGKIIRGAALSDSSGANMIVTGKGRQALGELKIQAELNLGAIDNATSIAANCAYKKIGYTNYAIAITGEAYRAQFKEVLEWIVSCLDGTLNVSGLYQVQRNIYMHCQGGCDRTGTLSFQLLGLLGVSESDLAKEYELSSFSDVGFGRLRTTTKAVDTYDYVGMVEALKTYSGDTITDKFVSFAIDCGISNDTITSFRNLMLE